MFKSHHPVHQKLGVVRKLLDCCKSVVTEEADIKAEKEHISKVLACCGYPAWSIRKVENQSAKTPTTTKSRTQNQEGW